MFIKHKLYTRDRSRTLIYTDKSNIIPNNVIVQIHFLNKSFL